VCHAGDTGNVACANDRRAIASYARTMQFMDGRRHLMKRIAVVIGIVIGIAATPTVVTASDSNGQSQNRIDPYEHSRMWDTQRGQVYGPVQAGPSTTYGFIGK
jgi:hypothetical protein